MDHFKNLSKSVRVWLLIASILISLLLICNITGVNKDKEWGVGNGLDYGLDFAGGTEMWLKLEHNVSSEVMTLEKGILESRLNSIGLKDIPLTVYGDQYIIIKIAKASPEEIKKIEDILKQQARFEERIDGEVAVLGSEISVDLSPQGSGMYPTTGGGYGWYVSLKLNSEGACRFGKVAQGKYYGADNPKNRPVDLFIDRPENTTILMSAKYYGLLGNTTSSGLDAQDIYYGDTAQELIMKRAGIPIIVFGGDDNKTIADYNEYLAKGYTRTIIAEDESKISERLKNMVQDLGIDAQRMTAGNQSIDTWIMQVTGLKTTPRLNFDTKGECVYAAQITGGSNNQSAAEAEVQMNQVWLTSGNLPEKAVVESKSTVPASLGAQFLRYSLLTGIIGVLSVSLVIFFRYRKFFIVAPVIITGFSEIVIMLGVAAIINWEIDLPAIAGIIAAVGTGVDNQIVITDETLASKGQAKRSTSVAERIRRAFFIIFTSAATIIAVMLPLMTFVAGMLKGFALTTMLGVLIGVFITRPAYAKIIEEFLKDTE
jgi:preprotein translocase subunit SecD